MRGFPWDTDRRKQVSITSCPNDRPFHLGTVLGIVWSQYRLDMIEVESEEAIIYRATPLQDHAYGHDDHVVVDTTVFVVVLRQPLDPEVAHTLDRWQVARKQMRKAMTLVDPAIAGFPEWNKIRQDNPVKCDQDEVGLLHWGAFQVFSYRRVLAKAKAEYRRPSNFSAAMRKSLLVAAGGQCRRCRSDQKLEADHILPISHGGTNDLANGMILLDVSP